MIPSLDACRLLLDEYATALRALRCEHRLTLRTFAAEVGIDFATLSRIETGQHVPTVDEAERIADWMVARSHRHLFGDTRYDVLGSARCTDPAQSHATVRSIDADQSYVGRILYLAERWWPRPFNDTDLRDGFTDTWLRSTSAPWQRNVIAKSRVNLHSHIEIDATGRRVRVETPGAPLRRVEPVPRPDQGQPLATAHFIYVPPTERHTP